MTPCGSVLILLQGGDDFWNMTDGEACKFAIEEMTHARNQRPSNVLDSHRGASEGLPCVFRHYAQMRNSWSTLIPEKSAWAATASTATTTWAIPWPAIGGGQQHQDRQDLEERVVGEYR